MFYVVLINHFISAAFLTQTVCLDDTTVKFEIWDTAGQERYHSLAPMYYRGAQAAIVVYDITNSVSRFIAMYVSIVQVIIYVPIMEFSNPVRKNGVRVREVWFLKQVANIIETPIWIMNFI